MMHESTEIKKWLQVHGDMLKIVYSYAVAHKVDITSKTDVLKVLQAIDPENANEKEAAMYSKMLQLFRDRFRKTAREALQS